MTGSAKQKTTQVASTQAAAKRRTKPTGTPAPGSGAAAPEGRKSLTRAWRVRGKAEAVASGPSSAIIRPMAGTKKDLLVSLLSKKAGADAAALSAALGWQAHTTRAALTRLRQAGFPLEAVKPAGGGRPRPHRERLAARASRQRGRRNRHGARRLRGGAGRRDRHEPHPRSDRALLDAA